nr:MAG TPA: hypothetical protein [Caudoviricetes sp.]
MFLVFCRRQYYKRIKKIKNLNSIKVFIFLL